MSKRFFIRFNLHKSNFEPADEPTSIKSFIDINDDEINEIFEEFEEIQKARSERVKKKCEDCISRISGKKVVFVGDSITSERLGYRTTVSLAADLDALDSAISGATTSSIRDYSVGKMRSFSPDVVSIMLGSNDSLGVDDRVFYNVSPSEYKRNLEVIVKRAAELGAMVMLMEMPYICPEKFKAEMDKENRFQSNEVVDMYNEIVGELAEKYGTILMRNDWMREVEDYPSLFEPDGLHLSLKGHEMMAEIYIRTLSEGI